MGSRERWTGPTVLLACALGLAACVHRPPVDAGRLTADPPAGEVAYEVLPDPAAPHPDLPEGYQIAPPRLRAGSGRLPEYPPRALTARYGDAVSLVRIVVSSEGAVSSMQSSPLGASTGGPFAPEFEAAVREAVASWQFVPATVSRLDPGPDEDGDGVPDFRYRVESETIPYYIDLRFRFEIIDGKGEVSIDNGGPR